jgi:tripartite-type tricarboxylate transporter receptor subunit TctC
MAMLAAAAGLPARAADAWPTRPVKLIIPFPAGGATDYGARAMGMALADAWHQPVVFDNRVGAGSTIGTEAGAKSAPDGYTLVMGIPAGVSIAPHLYPKLGYAPLTDLSPVAGFATSPLVVVVPAASPAKTFRQLVDMARASPGKMTYASNGSGSMPHLTTAWFASRAGVDITHVPYRGSAQALPDLMAGRPVMAAPAMINAAARFMCSPLRAINLYREKIAHILAWRSFPCQD